MKKSKILLLISTIVITTSLVLACTNKENSTTSTPPPKEDVKEDVKDDVKSDDEQASIPPSKEESPKKNDTSYDKDTPVSKPLPNETKNKLNNKIPYPIFNNINNKDKVNELILNYAKKLDTLYNTDGDTLNIDYKITFQNSKYISIYFSGDINATTAAYPSKFKSTLNINIEKASTIQLKNIVNINKKFIEVFNKSLESEFNALGAPIPEEFKLDNLNSLLNQSDNNGNYISDVQSYFTNNNIVIILSVPHALGDYLEINIPNSSVENYII